MTPEEKAANLIVLWVSGSVVVICILIALGRMLSGYVKYQDWYIHWKHRNKTLKDYNIEQTLIVPELHGLLNYAHTQIEEIRSWKFRQLGNRLATPVAAEQLHSYLRKRYALSDEVFKRGTELAKNIELMTYRYGGNDEA